MTNAVTCDNGGWCWKPDCLMMGCELMRKKMSPAEARIYQLEKSVENLEAAHIRGYFEEGMVPIIEQGVPVNESGWRTVTAAEVQLWINELDKLKVQYAFVNEERRRALLEVQRCHNESQLLREAIGMKRLERPKESGLYWHRYRLDTPAELLEVHIDHRSGYVSIESMGDESIRDFSDYTGFWYGPVQPPT